MKYHHYWKEKPPELKKCLFAAFHPMISPDGLKGKTFGRPKKQMEKAFYESLKAWESGQMTIKQAAFNCGMTLSNFRYHLRRMSHADD